MTTNTTDSLREPRTEAGKALLTLLYGKEAPETRSPYDTYFQRRADICDIEQQARPRTEPMTRLIRASVDLLDAWGSRTDDGRLITAEWGEPDADGVYEPTFTATDDGWLRDREEQAAAEARRELLAKVEGLPEDDWLRVAGIEYVAAGAVMGIFEDYETRRLLEPQP